MFWLKTKDFAYALQVPKDSYEERWALVRESWLAETGMDGLFEPVSHFSPRPDWWSTRRDWLALLRATRAQDNEE